VVLVFGNIGCAKVTSSMVPTVFASATTRLLKIRNL
jgi:hypothetical protein